MCMFFARTPSRSLVFPGRGTKPLPLKPPLPRDTGSNTGCGMLFCAENYRKGFTSQGKIVRYFGVWKSGPACISILWLNRISAHRLISAFPVRHSRRGDVGCFPYFSLSSNGIVKLTLYGFFDFYGAALVADAQGSEETRVVGET